MTSLREFLRSKGANFIHCKKTQKLQYEGMEFGKKGMPSFGICFFSKAIRESGSIPTDEELKAHLDDKYAVYDTVTDSGVAGYTLGYMGETMQEGAEITL